MKENRVKNDCEFRNERHSSHWWEKWSNEYYSGNEDQMIQNRACGRCGFVQRRSVKSR